MKTNEAGSRPSDLDDRIEFPSGGPCSACGDGDTEQKYHKHVAPAPSGEPTTRSAVLSTLNLVAGPHEDPMTDDLTVPLAIELAKCRAIVCELVQCSPYPDFEDATGGCYFCGQHFGHDKACLYRRAEELINV